MPEEPTNVDAAAAPPPQQAAVPEPQPARENSTTYPSIAAVQENLPDAFELCAARARACRGLAPAAASPHVR
jgi:hypothetical protein